MSLIKWHRILDKMSAGRNGSVLVLGESLSGKTFFLNHILNHHLKGLTTYRLKPTTKSSKSLNSLQKIIQNATGKSQSVPAIMRDLKGRSVFIIDDLETWYLNTEKGVKLLNSLEPIN